MKDTVANHLVRYLERRGVRHVFGLCGHTNIAVLSAMADSRVEFVNVRHEQVAAHAADGYARATGKASVLLTHLGPGLTNAATGVANAALDCIPMVVIAGDVPSHYFGKHPHQEVNLHADGAQYEIYRPFVKRAWRVDDPTLFAEIIDKAFLLAESGQPGPVLVDVPMDVFSAEVDSHFFTDSRATRARCASRRSTSRPRTRSCAHMAEARQPLIYAGGGIVWHKRGKNCARSSITSGFPVAHSLMGKGALPDDHPLLLGMSGFWGTKLVNDTCLAADWVLGLGTRFKEADCSSWYRNYTFNIPPTRLIHIDIEPSEIGRNFADRVRRRRRPEASAHVLLQVARELYPSGRKPGRIAEQIARAAASSQPPTRRWRRPTHSR